MFAIAHDNADIEAIKEVSHLTCIENEIYFLDSKQTYPLYLQERYKETYNG